MKKLSFKIVLQFQFHTNVLLFYQNEACFFEGNNFNSTNPDNNVIGVHSNCHVTWTRGFDDSVILFKGDQNVHQIYPSPLNFNGIFICDPFTLIIWKRLLDAEYRASILAAWENSRQFPDLSGSNRLFLTLLGGDGFGHSFSQICNAIKSRCDYKIRFSTDLLLQF
jgi:hypothetical protein